MKASRIHICIVILTMLMSCTHIRIVNTKTSTIASQSTTPVSTASTTTDQTTYETTDATTPPLGPGSVENASITNETSSGLFLTWSTSKGTIDGYVIKAFIGNISHSTNTINCHDNYTQNEKTQLCSPKTSNQTCSNSMEYWILGLIPSQSFTVKISTENNNDDGKIIIGNTTEGKNMMDVSNFTTTDLAETTISLSWEPPETCLTFKNITYTVTWNTDKAQSNSMSENSITISNLTPGQQYEFILEINLFDGENPFKYQHEQLVMEVTYPSVPNITIVTTNGTTAGITINFTHAGKVDYYNVTLKLGMAIINNTNVFNTTNQCTFYDLFGDREYSIEIVTITGNRKSKPLTRNITTRVTNPGPITNLTVSNETNSGLLINWSPPAHPNGRIKEYVIQAFVGNICHSNNTITCNSIDDSKKRDNTIDKCSNNMHFWISELIPSQMFTVIITAKNNAGFGNTTTIEANTNKGDNIMGVRNFTMTNRTERTISFEWGPPELRLPFTRLNYTMTWTPAENGSGYNFKEASEIIISKLEPGREYIFTLSAHLFDGENTFNHTYSLTERITPSPLKVDIDKCNFTPPNITISFFQAKGKIDYYLVTLSNNVVRNVSNDTMEATFQGLDGGTRYNLTTITHTGTLYSKEITQEITTLIIALESSRVGVIVGAVSGVVIAGLIITLTAVWYYKRRYRKLKEEDGGQYLLSLFDLTRPIKMADFSKRLEEFHKDSDLLFSREFEEIQSTSPKKSSEVASSEQNRLKNRYVNILAFDNSLVKLMPVEEDDNSDYINANFIPGYNSPREYIATQGPLDSTINDFWRMVWEYKVPIIVMLTGVTENMKPKCAKYWSDELQVQIEYGDLMVMLHSVSTLNTYTLKIFKLRLGATERTVKHFFMHDWRDYDANLNPTDVANFISDVRRERRPSEPGPMVVHCSAGVGRTGTFVAIDYFMQFINNNDLQENIDIFQFVLRMRGYRQYMVQAEKQFIFIHETVNMLIQQKITDDNDTDDTDDEQVYQNAGFVPDDSIYVNVENGNDCEKF